MLVIVGIAIRRGLGRYLSRRPATTAEPSGQTAQALRLALTDAGVTFVNLGQMLSTRPDLLSPNYIRELSVLHADVPTQPWELIEPVVVRTPSWWRPSTRSCAPACSTPTYTPAT